MHGARPAPAPAPTPPPARSWSRYRYPQTPLRFLALLAALAFIGYALVYMDVRLERLLDLFGRLGTLLAERYYPPDWEFLATPRYLASILDSMQMAYLGALIGILLAIPLAWFASYNMTPSRRFLYPAARLVIMGCRAVHEMIWTIIFVSILGFGMLAGTLALALFCLGFAGKLFCEEIEAVDRGQVEAIRATGAGHTQVFVYAVLPQVRVAWTGISIYTWDVAFRAATVVGFFGAGGMGWYLQRHVQQLDNQRVAAIILSIVALVAVSEIASAWARARIAAGK